MASYGIVDDLTEFLQTILFENWKNAAAARMLYRIMQELLASVSCHFKILFFQTIVSSL